MKVRSKILILLWGLSSLLLFTGYWLLSHPLDAPVVEAPAPSPTITPEVCWSGTLAVQLPGYPDRWWVNYGTRSDNQVQICGAGLRVSGIQAFPDYSAIIGTLSGELAKWRDCALDGPPLCPDEYYILKGR